MARRAWRLGEKDGFVGASPDPSPGARQRRSAQDIRSRARSRSPIRDDILQDDPDFLWDDPGFETTTWIVASLAFPMLAGCRPTRSQRSASDELAVDDPVDMQVLAQVLAATQRDELHAAGTVLGWLVPTVRGVVRSDEGGRSRTRSVRPEETRWEVVGRLTDFAADPSGSTVCLAEVEPKQIPGDLAGVV